MSELSRKRWMRRRVRSQLLLPARRRWTGGALARLAFWWRVQLESRR